MPFAASATNVVVRLRADAWAPWVAIGTLLLAAATFVMAWFTRRAALAAFAEVKVAEELLESAKAQAEATAAAVETQVRPVMVHVPERVSVSPEDVVYVGAADLSIRVENPHQVVVVRDPPSGPARVLVSIPVRNIGHGPAMIVDVRLTLGSGQTFAGYATRGVVAPGEQTRATFFVLNAGSDFDALVRASETRDFHLEARYTDINGKQESVTRVSRFIPDPAGPETMVERLT